MRLTAMDSKLQTLLILGVVFLFLIALPFCLSTYSVHVLILLFFYLILTISWNLLAGYTGQFSFGHHAFCAIGAYASALLVLHLNVPIPVGMVTGGLLAGGIGYLLGVLCLRLRGFYFAMVTWGFAEIVRIILAMWFEVTRGLLGLEVPCLFGRLIVFPYYWLGLGLLMATFFITYRIVNSQTGLYIKAIRDDEDATGALGIDTNKLKCFISAIASSFAGFAGTYYAFYIGMITPALSEFTLMGMILYMAILGGYGALIGPIIGGTVIMLIWELFREYRTLWMILFAFVIIGIMRFMRGGIIGLMQKLGERYVKNEDVKRIIKLISI